MLTLQRPKLSSYRNQPIDSQRELIDWFLYDRILDAMIAIYIFFKIRFLIEVYALDGILNPITLSAHKIVCICMKMWNTLKVLRQANLSGIHLAFARFFFFWFLSRKIWPL